VYWSPQGRPSVEAGRLDHVRVQSDTALFSGGCFLQVIEAGRFKAARFACLQLLLYLKFILIASAECFSGLAATGQKRAMLTRIRPIQSRHPRQTHAHHSMLLRNALYSADILAPSQEDRVWKIVNAVWCDVGACFL
jgi:hypothetical protein